MTSNLTSRYAPASSKGGRVRWRWWSNRPDHALLAAFVALALTAGCSGTEAEKTATEQAATNAVVTVQSGDARHVFRVEVARTPAAQQRGLMFRTDIPSDGGMLFAPYPAEGGGPREASFWMKDTPSPLDIIFIRSDGTIAHIAENTIPYSTDPVRSGEPVAAVLEIAGGRAAELGISVGDKVSW